MENFSNNFLVAAYFLKSILSFGRAILYSHSSFFETNLFEIGTYTATSKNILYKLIAKTALKIARIVFQNFLKIASHLWGVPNRFGETRDLHYLEGSIRNKS